MEWIDVERAKELFCPIRCFDPISQKDFACKCLGEECVQWEPKPCIHDNISDEEIDPCGDCECSSYLISGYYNCCDGCEFLSVEDFSLDICEECEEDDSCFIYNLGRCGLFKNG